MVSGHALRMKRMIMQRGEDATWQKLTYSSNRNTATGWRSRDYTETEEIFVIMGRPSVRQIDTEMGNVTTVTREFLAQNAVGKGDRLVVTDGTYEVLDTPVIIQHRSEEVFRRFNAVRLDL